MNRKLKVHVEEIKYSGVGGGHRRKMIDDHEEQVANWYLLVVLSFVRGTIIF